MLKLKNIVKDYPTGDEKVVALSGVDIEFRKSEFVAVLGPSGCGKTTLLNIIGGLDKYTSGDLIITGRSTKEFDDADWDAYRNHSVGFVFQSYNLIPHQTVLANVELALTLSGVSKHERRRRAVEALERVGLGDQIKKKPSQMSGGQMQRVAIARALVNDPEILLADEPTGALDSETSVQIMDILKEIAADRLVIMVTHNPDLADTYATRTVKLLDGRIIDDSMPYESNDTAPALTKREQKAKKLARKNASMSPITALSLSLNNLMTKKARTFLTSFAGSIGIIGIALILSISTGVNAYIARVQEDTLSSYPIKIDAETVDMSALLTTLSQAGSGEAPNHGLDAVYQNRVMYELVNSLMSMDTTKNNLTDFKKYIESHEEFVEYLSAIKYTYDLSLSIFTTDPDGKVFLSDSEKMMAGIMSGFGMGDGTGTDGGIMSQNPMMSMGMASTMSSIWEEMLEGEDGELINSLLMEQYDVVYGKWPEAYNEVVLVVDGKNELDDMTLYTLGLVSYDEIMESFDLIKDNEQLDTSVVSWTYEEICEKSYALVFPDKRFAPAVNGGYTDISLTQTGMDYLYNSVTEADTLKIVGIIRPNGDAVASMMSGAIGYTTALTDYIVERTGESEIIKKQLDDPSTDVLTGLPFPDEDAPELSDAEKAELIKGYFATLNTAEKALLYTEIASVPPAEYINAALGDFFTKNDRAAIIAMMVQAYAQQMGTADTAQIEEYFAKMGDDELNKLAATAVTAQVTEMYAAQVGAQLSMMTQDQLAAMFDAAVYTEEQYAELYGRHMPKSESESTYEEVLEKLGYVDKDSPASISLFAATFADKDNIAALIAEYNKGVSAENQISYTDYVALMMSSITLIIDAISYVLIAFVAISLVVSSIMIGIITYISVLERTKEIGILRAIGASKRDVARVFNAETIIVGFAAGAIGIIFTLLILIPVNLILHALTGIAILNAQLPVAGAVILVVISVVLTVISGLFPSRIAAKKDPVVALRTE